MKFLMQLALLASIAAFAVADEEIPEEEWKWLACGRGSGGCFLDEEFQVPVTYTHELRCCSSVEIAGWTKSADACDVWHGSDLVGLDDRLQCFHDVTYAEAEEICEYNNATICSKDVVDAGCARGAGCGHNGDLIWTTESAPAREAAVLPFQDAVDPEEWLYLSCGKGSGKCGTSEIITAQAKEQHELRCCSDYPLDGWTRNSRCQNWHQSDVVSLGGSPDTCFHASTYAEAQEICKANDAYVCTYEQVEAGCVRGSGCGHDNDFIWTSTGPAPERPALPAPTAVSDDTDLFIACGAGVGDCDDESFAIAAASEQHEVRCCSPYPLGGWEKEHRCSNYHGSELTSVDGLETDQCFLASTYSEAQAICEANWGYVCTMDEVLSKCAPDSGCSTEGGLVWTSTEATIDAVAFYTNKHRHAVDIAGVCAGETARTSGDPHITTFDKLRYDCHGRGEFIIAMSQGSDPLAIHGRFERMRDTPKPTITTSVAIKVLEDIPIIQVTTSTEKIDGICVLSYSIGNEEVPVTGDIITFVEETFGEAVKVYTNGRNIVFTFPEVGALIQLTAGGATDRCVMNTNLCLTPENHGGADSIVGLFGSPDGDDQNDWKGRNGTIFPLPELCSIEDPTNTEARLCGHRKRVEGHEYCMDEWCVGHADNSLWSNETHATYNECLNREPDESFDDEVIDPEIIEACEDAEDPDGCAIDCQIAVEAGADIATCADEIVEEEEDSKLNETSTNYTGTTTNTSTTDIDDEEDEDDESVSDSSGSLGDPHFKTWFGEHFEYHGQCDMVLTKDKTFADGLGLEVQIRTKLVRFWSYIHKAAIRIGDDIFELQGSADPEDRNTHYWFNLEYQGDASSIGGFPLEIASSSVNKRTAVIDLSSKFPGQKIVISSFREFIRVDFQHTTAEAFGNTVGMMGEYKTGNLLARDGVRKLADFIDFGNEWQLLPTDDMLFRDRSEPQFPKRCILPEDPQGQRRRRLDESTITVEEAEAACSKVVGDALDIKDCVYDILATQDLDMVGAF